MRAFFALLIAYLLALGAAQAQITNPPPGNQTITGTSPVTATGTCTGTVINCILGIASQVLPGTTQTIHAAQWNVGNTYSVITASQTFTLDASSTLSPNGGMTIQMNGFPVTITPAAGDTINPETGGTPGTSITIGATGTPFLSLVTTDGAGKIHIAPTQPPTGGSGITIGSPITGTCTNGYNIFNNSGNVGCQANGAGSGITFTDGTNNVNGATKLTVTGGTIGGTTPNATLTIPPPGGGSMTVTDGTHSVAGTTQMTFTGNATVSGTTPNATVNVTGSGGGGGSLIKIGTATAANSTCLSWGVAVTGCVNGSTTNLSTLGYNTFQITCDSLAPGTSGAVLFVHVAEGTSTPTVETANYLWGNLYSNFSGAAVATNVGNSAPASNVGIALGTVFAIGVTQSSVAYLSLSTSSIPRNVRYDTTAYQAAASPGTMYYEQGQGAYTGDQNAITAITIDLYTAPISGTQLTGSAGLVSGSCTLYGLTP